MSYEVVFHPTAEVEYDEAYQWYEEQLTGLGDRFEKAVEVRLNQIWSSPLLYQKKRGVFREAKIDTFPYQIVYKIYDKKNIIFISAIYHSSRNPKKKYRR
jgi:mRNA-degrading endonuclease RelE of RelBE toxin-antitoxin system